MVVRTPEELRRALVASPVPRLIGSLDRQRFLAILRSLPPQATGLLPAMRPGEPLPLDRLMLWRLDSPQGRISRQPAAELTSTASSTSR